MPATKRTLPKAIPAAEESPTERSKAVAMDGNALSDLSNEEEFSDNSAGPNSSTFHAPDHSSCSISKTPNKSVDMVHAQHSPEIAPESSQSSTLLNDSTEDLYADTEKNGNTITAITYPTPDEHPIEADTTDNSSTIALDETLLRSFTTDIRLRIQSFANFADPATLTYSINKLPSIDTWGQTKHKKNWSYYICDKTTNKPYTVWIVGKISKVWLFGGGPQGAPKAHINIAVEPFGINSLTM
ncbi:hypothetical protein SERLADRAFT_414926 [Serpula lacrymans var. lacrymans S7.9]|uniref:Uncharacterized protein n=1 Tax=Serpula lacrymans var. lacrymans (strain S7.9) TaxID=578457 RepID=F8NUV9_SERL9|nr:uncharacterized protein SERLADRAFT_414926 [Serpula lacrymans var. lacrymans S7.9]EGO25274.1 hypothetical protein SERLADRAFT_414926 [Serpula lacrymans var. lacrymans S7.9]